MRESRIYATKLAKAAQKQQTKVLNAVPHKPTMSQIAHRALAHTEIESTWMTQLWQQLGDR